MYLISITYVYVLGLGFSSQHQRVKQCKSQIEHAILLIFLTFQTNLQFILDISCSMCTQSIRKCYNFPSVSYIQSLRLHYNLHEVVLLLSLPILARVYSTILQHHCSLTTFIQQCSFVESCFLDLTLPMRKVSYECLCKSLRVKTGFIKVI